MRFFLVAAILFVNTGLFAQDMPDSTFRFSGFIFDKDSIPVEGAYVINYRTMMGMATNQDGHFSLTCQPGDSLMVSHISYKREIIKVNSYNPMASPKVYYMHFAAHEMSPLIVLQNPNNMKYFAKNIDQMNKQIKKMVQNIRPNTNGGAVNMSTNPALGGGVGISFNLADVAALFVKKKTPDEIRREKAIHEAHRTMILDSLLRVGVYHEGIVDSIMTTRNWD
ncbi:hypothetical protein PbJCM13498_38870 [Prolixibacter bellariivorans]|uniref:Carboxypeptidase-like regulatory domain-containing protein n=1 Tax=Prolixibacter bellariivorans TaxID=314319 RepID=A0A5M4B4H5_9BACT|nr:carboxypeptidase-like regulatory domain-containing protein [Prolixibacter bellariivorans]GET35024.1 hypothetical protein PbJCM13498_38870 [Prolixibacter bellariivorans]